MVSNYDKSTFVMPLTAYAYGTRNTFDTSLGAYKRFFNKRCKENNILKSARREYCYTDAFSVSFKDITDLGGQYIVAPWDKKVKMLGQSVKPLYKRKLWIQKGHSLRELTGFNVKL